MIAEVSLAARLWLPLSLGSVAAQLAGLACLDRLSATPAQALRLQLALWLLAGVLWFLSLFGLGALLKTQSPAPGRLRRWLLWGGVLGLGLLPRLLALPLPVTHSQDVYRYVWDGAVQRAGLNPYLAPPADARYAAVQAEQAEAFARINHRHLPTIYPPAAQLAFLASARLGPRAEPLPPAILRWKLLCGGSELVLLGVLGGLLRRRGQPWQWLVLWLLCPLPAMELWLNGHVDGLGLLFLSLALLGWPRTESGSPAAASPPTEAPGPAPATSAGVELGSGLAWLLACLVKPLSLVLLPSLRGLPRARLLRFAAAAGLAALLVWLPYRQAGLRVTPSLGEYGRRWRSNDGAFALLQGVSETAVALAYRPPYFVPWRIPGLARLITGRDRGTVWPDELAGFLARGLAALPFLLLLRLCLRRRLAAERAALLLLSCYALFTPVLHPWYLLWPLLFAPLWRPAAWPVLALCALAPLSYLPLVGELRGQPHSEALAPRLIEHGAAWLLVLYVADRLRRELSSVRD